MFKRLGGIIMLAWMTTGPAVAGTFRVAAYNVETYLDTPTASRPHIKSPEARAKVRESIHALNPDVLALEEMGGTNALLELRAALAAEGLDFPYWEHVQGYDTNIHVAVLSRLPIIARHPHTNDSLLVDGHAFRVSRGFAEVEIRAATNFTFTLIAAHLKSKRPVGEADEAELRLAEAKALRGIVDGHLRANPAARLVVLGDFNDTVDSAPIKAIMGRGQTKLADTRPAERNGDTPAGAHGRYEPRNVAWTYFYGEKDEYSRIDYLLISPALVKNWLRQETYIPVVANWGVGSDHRPIVAAFSTDN